MILRHEIRKILSMPALWGFVVLLAVLNGAVAFGGSMGEEIEYINAVNTLAGDKYCADYNKRLAAILPPDDDGMSIESYYHEDLVAAAEGFEIRTAKYYADEFAAYKESSEVKNGAFGELIISLMGSKYEKAERIAARKLASGEVNYVALAGETGRAFGNAAGSFGVMMLAECALIAVLAVMFSLSYENICNTDMLLYTTASGRRKIALNKIAASVAVSSTVFLLIFALGYGTFFALNDFSQISNVPISAYYNSVSVSQVMMPVLAWGSMTFGEYFICSALLGYVLMIVFLVFACAVGLAVKNTYAGFGAVALAVLLNIAFIIVPPTSAAGALLVNMFPAGIINLMPAWFQYGSTATLFAFQELILSAFWLLFMLAASVLSLKYFIKKDMK